MNFAILRTKKLKTIPNISGSLRHQYRERKTSNADPARRGLNIESHTNSGEALAAIKARLKQLGKIRKNGVLAVEYLITASPEWFKTDAACDRDEVGTGRRYFERSLEWLRKKHGEENVICSVIHHDETSPHMSVFVVPALETPKGSRLNARAFFGGRAVMSKLQTDFAEDVGADFGLQRGIEGSQSRHTSIKKYYQQVKTAMTEIPDPDKAKSAVAKALAWDREQKSREARARALEELRKRSTRLREIPLEDVLAKSEIDPDRRDRNNYKTPVGRITVTGQKFHNHTTKKGGGGAIDLVMMLNECTMPQAVQWLASTFGEGPVCEQLAVSTRQQVSKIVAGAPPLDPLKPYRSTPSTWDKVRSYLVDVRGISGKFVDYLKTKGKVWSDGRANAVFPLNPVDVQSGKVGKETIGVYLRGTVGPDNDFKGVRGEKGVFLLPAPPDSVDCPELGVPPQLAVVEAPIDAISLQELGHFKGEVVATCGNPSHEVSVWLQSIAKVKALFLATDNDLEGEKQADALGVGTRYKPQGKDWSEDLMKLRLDSCAGTAGADKQRASGPGSSGSLADGM
jgi:hypothetical protein